MKTITKALLLAMILSLVLTVVAGCSTECVHTGGTATCTEQAICELCNEPYGELAAHTPGAVTCTEAQTCTVCAVELAPAPGHKYEAVVTNPTCVEVGYTTYTCVCGDSYVADEVPATGKKYEVVVTAPTCTTGGYTTVTCTCGDSYITDEVPATGHNYEAVVTAPTCTEAGYTTHTCHCGDTYVDAEVAALGHKYEAVVTAPTCTDAGFTTNTCSVCGDTYVDAEVAALGHKYEAVVTAPTCTEAGFTTNTCSVCGDTYVDAEVAALGHDRDENGICKVCGDIIPVLPELNKGYIFGMAQGDKVYYMIGQVKDGYIQTNTDASKALRVFLEEANGGYYLYAYVNGAKTYINMIFDNIHVDAVFSNAAHTVYTIDQATKTLVAKINGADYRFGARSDKAETTISATKVANNGYYGEFYYAHAHSFKATGTVAPTCTTGGYTTYACACGETYTSDVVAALGHDYKAVETIAPSCFSEGLITYTCHCGEIGGKQVLAAKHEVGKNGGYCEKCQFTVVDNIDDLKAALKITDNKVFMMTGVYATDSWSIASGVTLIAEDGAVITGTLTSNLDNVTIKNLYIKSSNAQRWAYAKGTLVFENVTFEATGVYALHFDGITAGANILYKDCTIIGWAAMSGSPESVVFDGCTIKGNGTYGLIRAYFNATIKNCTFDVANVNTEDVYQDGIHAVNDAVIIVENCTNVNGAMLDILDTSGAGKIIIDGTEFHVHKYTKEVTPYSCIAEGYTTYTCKCGYSYVGDQMPMAHHENAEGVCYGCGYVMADNAEELIAALDAGKNVLLMTDLTIEASLSSPYGNPVGVAQKGGIFDGNGHTLTVNGSKHYAITTSGGTIKNLTINNGSRAIVTFYPTEDVIIDNVTITGEKTVYGINTAELGTVEGIQLIVKNSSLMGWHSFDGGFASATFENCKFTQGVAYPNVTGRTIRPYITTNFVNCEFVKNANLSLTYLKAGATVTMTGCTAGGTAVTSDVFYTDSTYPHVIFIYDAAANVELITKDIDNGVSFHYHNYTAKVTAPTCTAAGYTTNTCVCGDSYKDAEVAALGHKDEDENYKCDKCSTKMLPPAGTALTIKQALTIAKMQSHNTYTSQKYYITGIVTGLYNTQYGNFYIKDEAGNQICIYGLYSADGKTRYDAMSYKPINGDEVTVYTVLGMYNSTAQGKNAWLDEVIAHEHDYVATVTAPTCTKEGYTTHVCSLCGDSKVDTKVAALGHTTDNGTCERCEEEIGGDAPAYETFMADFGTVAANSSYTTRKTTSGWTGTNCAVMQGGSSDNNPTFKVFGTAATRAFTMNGKTSAKGKIVSPTLSGGISKITFNYTNCFSESKGVDITITIKQNGTAVATQRLDNNSVTKLKAYTFTWELDTAISGDFTIEITNNSPTNSTSNKDRVSIWNLEWTNNPS